MLTNADATVTICHSRTRDLAAICREADILVAAIGRPRMVDASYVKPGAFVIDVGTTPQDGVVVGDVDRESVEPVAGWLTPGPGRRRPDDHRDAAAQHARAGAGAARARSGSDAMPSMRIRWSEQEARKPYARPFMVTFTGDDGTDVGSVALNGADLLYYTQFQTAVLSLAGELFVDTAVEASADPQRAWLDRIAGLMPAIGAITITPRSTFDDTQGRVFRMVIKRRRRPGGNRRCVRAPRVPGAAGGARSSDRRPLPRPRRSRRSRMPATAGVPGWEHCACSCSRPDPGEAMNEAWHWA